MAWTIPQLQPTTTFTKATSCLCSQVAQRLGMILWLILAWLQKAFKISTKLKSCPFITSAKGVDPSSKCIEERIDSAKGEPSQRCVDQHICSVTGVDSSQGCIDQTSDPVEGLNPAQTHMGQSVDLVNTLHNQQEQDLNTAEAMAEAKRSFLAQHASNYGYGGKIEQVLAGFSRLTTQKVVYLDHAGATPYSEEVLDAAYQCFRNGLFGNPHSASGQDGDLNLEAGEELRRLTLQMCNADPADYVVIFTSGATAALKLVGECFPWSTTSHFTHTLQNHNSVLGIRGYASKAGARVTCVDTGNGSLFDGSTMFTARGGSCAQLDPAGKVGADTQVPCHLFAFPLECNFSGQRFSQDIITQVRSWGDGGGDNAPVAGARGRWLVLLDAAKACSTAPPNLRAHAADFTALSYYKICGYPSGLGALIARKSSLELLHKPYFGGGTVQVAVADEDFSIRRPGPAGWEDGTSHFLAIVAASKGLRYIDSLGGFPGVHRHTQCLTAYLAQQLQGMRHYNGCPVCQLYGYTGPGPRQGPMLALNLLRADGSWVGYREVERLARINSIHIRTGGFCNPGACSKFLQLTGEQMRSHFEAGHVCWDDHDVINGQPTGAIRVSLGFSSSFEDVFAFLTFVRKYFVETINPVANSYPAVNGLQQDTMMQVANGTLPAAASPECSSPQAPRCVVSALYLYPLKSCAPQQVSCWPLGPNGLLFDREWALVTEGGKVLTQKKCPHLTRVHPHVDLVAGTLTLTCPNMGTALVLPIPGWYRAGGHSSQGPRDKLNGVRVCGDTVCGVIMHTLQPCTAITTSNTQLVEDFKSPTELPAIPVKRVKPAGSFEGRMTSTGIALGANSSGRRNHDGTASAAAAVEAAICSGAGNKNLEVKRTNSYPGCNETTNTLYHNSPCSDRTLNHNSAYKGTTANCNGSGAISTGDHRHSNDTNLMNSSSSSSSDGSKGGNSHGCNIHNSNGSSSSSSSHSHSQSQSNIQNIRHDTASNFSHNTASNITVWDSNEQGGKTITPNENSICRHSDGTIARNCISNSGACGVIDDSSNEIICFSGTGSRIKSSVDVGSCECNNDTMSSHTGSNTSHSNIASTQHCSSSNTHSGVSNNSASSSNFVSTSSGKSNRYISPSTGGTNGIISISNGISNGVSRDSIGLCNGNSNTAHSHIGAVTGNKTASAINQNSNNTTSTGRNDDHSDASSTRNGSDGSSSSTSNGDSNHSTSTSNRTAGTMNGTGSINSSCSNDNTDGGTSTSTSSTHSRNSGLSVPDWFERAIGTRCFVVQHQQGTRHARLDKSIAQRKSAPRKALEASPAGEACETPSSAIGGTPSVRHSATRQETNLDQVCETSSSAVEGTPSVQHSDTHQETNLDKVCETLSSAVEGAPSVRNLVTYEEAIPGAARESSLSGAGAVSAVGPTTAGKLGGGVREASTTEGKITPNDSSQRTPTSTWPKHVTSNDLSRSIPPNDSSKSIPPNDSSKSIPPANGSPESMAPDDLVEGTATIGFSNESQFLLVSEASVTDLAARLATSADTRVDAKRFRPNIVVAGVGAYEEDTWSGVRVGSCDMSVDGPCARCDMVRIDQEAGMKLPADILLLLAGYRRRRGKLTFGVLLSQSHAAHPTPPDTAGLGGERMSDQWIEDSFEHVLKVGGSVVPRPW